MGLDRRLAAVFTASFQLLTACSDRASVPDPACPASAPQAPAWAAVASASEPVDLTPLAPLDAKSSPPAEGNTTRPVGLGSGHDWKCPFPKEADVAKIDSALVSVNVTVKPDGRVAGVWIAKDPGYGFGAVAGACAMLRRYQPALDGSGSPVMATATVNVRFVR
jgi:protein TonB